MPRAMAMDISAREMAYDRCKRAVQAYVCQIEKGISLRETLKILNTAMSNIEVTQYQMKGLFSEVAEKTVEAFRDHIFYSDRRNRLHELERSLGMHAEQYSL